MIKSFSRECIEKALETSMPRPLAVERRNALACRSAFSVGLNFLLHTHALNLGYMGVI